jgi:hypothetical protein
MLPFHLFRPPRRALSPLGAGMVEGFTASTIVFLFFKYFFAVAFSFSPHPPLAPFPLGEGMVEGFTANFKVIICEAIVAILLYFFSVFTNISILFITLVIVSSISLFVKRSTVISFSFKAFVRSTSYSLISFSSCMLPSASMHNLIS